MSSGMNRAQAEEYAKTMTYKQAISNIRTGKGIIYRKATMIKLRELAEIADKFVPCKDCKWWQDSEVGVAECPICTRIHDMVFEMGAYDYCSKGKCKEDDEA